MNNIAVIGAGYWGKNLVRNFYDLGVLKVICDANLAIQTQMRTQYPTILLTADLAVVLNDPQIKGIAIATPAETHFKIAKAALEADKHVFVEKPLCLNVQDAQELIALAAARGKQLMVGHVLHYHPAVIQMKSMLAAGEIGTLEYFYSNRLNLGKFRTEENILWSFAPHDISLMLSLVQDYPQQVHCVGGSYLSKQIADVTMCTFGFASGVRGHIFVSWLHPTKEQKVIVVGSRGMFVFDDVAPPERKLAIYRHKVIWKDGTPTPDRNEPEYLSLKWREPLGAELQAFLSAIQTGLPALTHGLEGLQTLRLLNDCENSLRNERPVEVFMQEANNPVHPSAIIDPDVTLGKNTRIWHYSHVCSGAVIGADCSLGQNVFIGSNVHIGNHVKIQNNVSVYEKVEIEDGVFLGPSMVFTNVMNPRSEVSRKHEYRVTRVKRGATIGANATIICGHTIGAYAFVGAGAVVTRDVPDYALVYGAPARVHGWMCQCGEKLNGAQASWKCPACHKNYIGAGKDWQQKGLDLSPAAASV